MSIVKLLLIAQTLEAKGGAGRHALEIANALKNSGINIRILTESNKKILEEQKNTLYPLGGPGIIKFIVNIISARKEASDFGVIHAMDVWPYGVYGYFAVLGTEKKLFINGVGTYSVLPGRNIFKRFLMRRACMRADKIFCISDYTEKRILEKIGLNNTCVVLYGTVKLPELSIDEIKKYKEQYGITRQYPILLTVGAIKERKGQIDTLKAVHLLKTQYPDVKYIIMGDDGDKYYVQQIRDYAEKNGLNKNCEIISGVYDDRVLSFFYQICDIFLLNSNNAGVHFEGFGGVLLEAVQFGKPVIGSRDCGIENALKDCYNGYLTEQKNPEDIKEKILLVFKNKEELFRNAKEFYKNFSWGKTVSEYIKYYAE